MSSRLGAARVLEPDREPSGPGEEIGDIGRSTILPRLSHANADIKSYFPSKARDIGFISAAAKLSQGVSGEAGAACKQASQPTSVGFSEALQASRRSSTAASRHLRRDRECEVFPPTHPFPLPTHHGRRRSTRQFSMQDRAASRGFSEFSPHQKQKQNKK